MRRVLFCAIPAIALTCVLALPDVSFAQRRGGLGVGFGPGGMSIGSGSGYYGGGYPGYGGYGSGYGYPGYGGYGSGIGIGSGGIHYGSGYGGYGSGYGYPGYGGWNYGSGYGSPGYYGNSNVYQSGAWSQGPMVSGAANASYQSLYPPNGGQFQGGQFNDPSRATIRVHVPPDAEVMFEGSQTQQRGPERVFITPPLEGTGNYTYKVTARWRDQDGKDVNRSETVRFSAGRTVDVDFASAQNQGQKNLRPNPAGSEEQSEPNQTNPNRNNQDQTPQAVPRNPGNATTPPERRQPD